MFRSSLSTILDVYYVIIWAEQYALRSDKRTYEVFVSGSPTN